MRNPFDLSDAVIRDEKHVKVTRHAPKAGRPCEYRKVFNARHLGHAAYWSERENEFLLEFGLKKLSHVVEFAQVSRGGNDAPVVESVTTRDAGITLEDWLRVRPRYASEDTLKHPFRHAGMFLELLRACLLALQEIHRHGIIHCDIKEDNICLPYTPYPLQAGVPVRIDFKRLRLIDFAFSISQERPLRHRLPVEPEAPYQSNLLKVALTHDRTVGSSDGLQAQQLDWRIDLYSLGYLAGKILGSGLLQPQGSNGHAAFAGAGRLVERLKAYDNREDSGGELPHASLIAEIDSLLAALTDSEDYRWFSVDGLQDIMPYTAAPLTPIALDNGKGTAGREANAVVATPSPHGGGTGWGRSKNGAVGADPKPVPAWMGTTAVVLSALAIAWAMPHGYADWTGVCGPADEDRQIRECRLWTGGPLLWRGPVKFALSPPPLPVIADANLASSADGLLALGVANQQYRIGEQLKIQYALAKPFYLRLLVVNSSGQVETLFPEPGMEDKPADAGKVHSLGGLYIDGPPGQDRLVALASAEPLPDYALVDGNGKLTPQTLALTPTVVRLAYRVVQRQPVR